MSCRLRLYSATDSRLWQLARAARDAAQIARDAAVASAAEAAAAALGVTGPSLSISAPTALTRAAHLGRRLVLTASGNQLTVAWSDTGDGFVVTLRNFTTYWALPVLTGFTDALVRGPSNVALSQGLEPGGTAVLLVEQIGAERIATLIGQVA